VTKNPVFRFCISCFNIFCLRIWHVKCKDQTESISGSATLVSDTGTALFHKFYAHLYSLFWQSSVAHFQLVCVEQPENI
jgi:hypothetical protein